jgi:hypothetical protein
MDVYRAGFIGATTPEASEWVGSLVGDAKLICVPFAGTGRDIASMAGEGRTIESWDTQHYSRCIIEGVFAAKKVETNVDKIRYRKGWMEETRAIKYIDERSAGFIDWVAQEGTLYDKACLGSAIVRCSLMGRMTQWHANVEQLYARYQRQFDYNKDYVGLPGTFIHHEESFFGRHKHEIELTANATDAYAYDLMQIDPPKVVMGSDVYSANFSNLHLALSQTETDGWNGALPKWNWREVLGYFKQVMDIPVRGTIFLYVSKVRPDYEEVKRLLLQYGTIEEEREFSHGGRTDYGLHIDRT